MLCSRSSSEIDNTDGARALLRTPVLLRATYLTGTQSRSRLCLPLLLHSPPHKHFHLALVSHTNRSILAAKLTVGIPDLHIIPIARSHTARPWFRMAFKGGDGWWWGTVLG